MLYEAIFKRKSVRQYQTEPLPQSELDQILAYSQTIQPLLPEIKTKFLIVGGGEVRTLITGKPPHYILLFSEEKSGFAENAGFMIEQMELYLSASGYGSCLIGLVSQEERLEAELGLTCVITIALGRSAEPSLRENPADFKRRTVEQFSQSQKFTSLLEVARLSPSFLNRQPWFVVESDNSLLLYRKTTENAPAMKTNNVNDIDMGVFMLQLKLAAEASGYEIAFTLERNQPNYQEYSYIGRADLKKI